MDVNLFFIFLQFSFIWNFGCRVINIKEVESFKLFKLLKAIFEEF